MASQLLRSSVQAPVADETASSDTSNAAPSAETGRSLGTRWSSPRWLAALSFVGLALVVVAWSAALNAPYQYDDFNTPVGDAASQSLTNFWHALPRTLRPLTKFSYALESSLGASAAPARRVLNALLFGGCIAMLQRLLRLAGVPMHVAVLVACVWALHPVHAETIVALAGRPVLLSLFLILVSAVLLQRSRHRLALLCAVLALLARESALPWLVVCAGWVAHARGVSPKSIAAVSLGALAAGALVLASSSHFRSLVVSAFAAAGAWNRLGLQWAALTDGTLMLFANPAGFTPDIEFAPRGGVRLALILITLAAYAGAAWLAFAKLRSRDVRLFALVWLCLVVPTHSVVPKLDVLTARPFSASLAPLLALTAVALMPRLIKSTRFANATPLALLALCVLLVPLARRRAALYRDPIALWRDAAERTRYSVRPLVNLGTLLARDGQLREARTTLTLAVLRDPARYDTRLRLDAVQRALFATDPAHSGP